MFVAWPFFLYRKYGNTAYRLEGKTIIVCNHYSTFDAFFIYLIFGREKIHFVTIAETKKRCLSRFVTSIFDCLFIDYETTNFGFFKRCIDILEKDGVICIFPEGEINPCKVGFFDFKNSFMFFAKKTGAKILPLYIYPELQAFKRSSVYIGEVIGNEEYGRYATYEQATAFVQSKIMEYGNIVRPIVF